MRKSLQTAALAAGAAIPLFYIADMRRAYRRLNEYGAADFRSEFGKMAYADEGWGEAILISHGIFGGFDQGMASLKGIAGENHRKIALSRFGYPGSKLPAQPTPQNQARVFAELLDELNIKKTFIMATSAGGAAALSFALTYPERTKGLVLVSSGVPSHKMPPGQLKPAGPPIPMLNEFPMWLSVKSMRPIFGVMFGSAVDKEFLQTMLPVKPRRKGIEADAHITNLDMDVNYEKYPVEDIKAPILVIHAKDDPIALFDMTEKFIARTHPETLLFETGGHLMSGHQKEITAAVNAFIREHA